MKQKALMESLPVKQITVLLADDHAVFRKSLKVLIEVDGDIRVVGEAKIGCEAVSLAKSLNPDVIVMDIAMPLLNGLQATQKIMAASPASRVLILSAHPDPEYIEQAMNFGASGYLFKQSSTQFLAHAIREVKMGNTYLNVSIPKRLRVEYQALFVKYRALKEKLA